jgi:hypothetical protein
LALGNSGTSAIEDLIGFAPDRWCDMRHLEYVIVRNQKGSPDFVWLASERKRINRDAFWMHLSEEAAAEQGWVPALISQFDGTLASIPMRELGRISFCIIASLNSIVNSCSWLQLFSMRVTKSPESTLFFPSAR